MSPTPAWKLNQLPSIDLLLADGKRDHGAMTEEQTVMISNVAAAVAVGVDHSWMPNVIDCALGRIAEKYSWGQGEDWEDACKLHTYASDRYFYLWPGAILPGDEGIERYVPYLEQLRRPVG